jgi:hypothetical protein
MKKIIVTFIAISLTSCVTIQKQYVDGKVVKDSTKVFVGLEFRKGK